MTFFAALRTGFCFLLTKPKTSLHDRDASGATPGWCSPSSGNAVRNNLDSAFGVTQARRFANDSRHPQRTHHLQPVSVPPPRLAASLRSFRRSRPVQSAAQYIAVRSEFPESQVLIDLDPFERSEVDIIFYHCWPSELGDGHKLDDARDQPRASPFPRWRVQPSSLGFRQLSLRSLPKPPMIRSSEPVG